MRRQFFSIYPLLIFVSCLVAVQLVFIAYLVLPEFFFAETSVLQILVLFGFYLLIVAVYDIAQRTINAYRYRLLDRQVVENTEQHTLYVTASSLAKRISITPPLLIISDDATQIDSYNAVILPGLHSAILSISKKLIYALTPDELEGVIAHEYAHISLGHVNAMSWMNSLLQVSLLLPARILSFFLNPLFKLGKQKRDAFDVSCTFFLITHAGLLLLCVNLISQRFEKQADQLAVQSTSNNSLLSALKSLKAHFQNTFNNTLTGEQSNIRYSRFMAWQRLSQFFQSHPTVQSRIDLLQAKDPI